jgi:hypothetical protein
MKPDIRPEVKGVSEAIGRYVPTASQTRPDMQAIIELQEAIVECIAGPDRGLVAGKSWIKRGDARRLIVMKDLWVQGLWVTGTAGQKQGDRQ